MEGSYIDNDSSNVMSSILSANSININGSNESSSVVVDIGGVIEVVIEDNTMLLGIDNNSTVSSIAQSAYTEYLSFHPALLPRYYYIYYILYNLYY